MEEERTIEKMFKTCRICGVKKTIDNFAKSGKWFRTECKECQRAINKKYQQKNKEKYYLKHREYVVENKDKYKEYAKKSYEKNKTQRLEKEKIYRDKHKEETKIYNKEYYKKNIDDIKQRTKNYRNNNLEKCIKKQVEYNKKKTKEDMLFKFKVAIRGVINKSFRRKEYRKNKHTEEIIGSDINSFIVYLLKTFKDNYGYEWDGIEKVHIDHIIPLATAKTEEDVIKLCHYTNLQLLKAKDNLKKGTHIEYKLERV